jgi:hypothetical protein
VTVSKRIGNVIDTVKAFGDVPAVFGTLVDLETDTLYQNMIIDNDLDQDITVKFVIGDEKEIIIEAGYNLVLDGDGFEHKGVIQYKYTSSAPTSGRLKAVNW